MIGDSMMRYPTIYVAGHKIKPNQFLPLAQCLACNKLIKYILSEYGYLQDMKNIIMNYLRAEWFQVINVYVKTKIIFNEVKYFYDNIMKNNIKI